MNLTAIIGQIVKALPDALRKRSGHLEEQRLNQEAIKRANQAADTWNERNRETWRADGHHA